MNFMTQTFFLTKRKFSKFINPKKVYIGDMVLKKKLICCEILYQYHPFDIG